MKRLILVLGCLLFLSPGIRAQVLGDFTDGTLHGFVSNAGGSDSIYITTDPAGVQPHALAWHMTLTGSNNAQMQGDNISVETAQLLTFWIYIPSSENMPDTTVLGIWVMDHANWSWKETDFKGSDVPKDTWYPISMPLTQIALKNPTSFNPTANQIRIGMQIQGAVWTGKFYIKTVALVGKRPRLITDPLTVQWANNHTVSITQVDTPVAGRSGAWADSLTGGDDSGGGAAFGDQPANPGIVAPIEHFLVTWVYVDSTFPDSAYIQTWAQSDPSWNWPGPIGPMTYNGSDIPRDMWYPLYFDLFQASIMDTSVSAGSYFNTMNSGSNLRKFGIQIGGTDWTGRVYMTDVSMIHDTVHNVAPPPVWLAADFEKATPNGLQGFYVPSYAGGKLSNIWDQTTPNGSNVLQGAADFGAAPHMFAAVRDTLPMHVADTIVTGISFQIYLPPKMPTGGFVRFFVSGGTGDSVAVVDTIGSDKMRSGQWNTLWITKLDSLDTVAGVFDASKPARVGVVVWYSGDTATWSGNLLFDNLTVYGISFPNQIADPVVERGVVKTFKLYSNYPNPFNPTTMVQYDVPRTSQVTVRVFDVLGREVATVVNAKQAAGTYKVNLNMSKFASGVYFLNMKAGSYLKTQKMMLIK